MKVLVVGGAGYIGSHVCKTLLASNYEVVIFDNLSSGLRQNILPRSIFRHGDILDPLALQCVCKEFRFDALIHLAAFKAAGESMLVPEKYSNNNISGSLNLIHAAIENGIKNFVFSSSAAVYGEPTYLPIDEKHPQNPDNYYGYTKLAIEHFLQWYDKLKGLKFAALRYFNAAGYDVEGELCGLEQNPANLVPVIMEAAMGTRAKLQIFGNDYATPDGTGVRDYVHVNDLASAHKLALEAIVKSGKSITVNLGSENGLSVLEMVKCAEEISGRKISYEMVGRRPGDTAKTVATSALAHELLGWKAQYSDVHTLLSTTWKAYRAHSERS